MNNSTCCTHKKLQQWFQPMKERSMLNGKSENSYRKTFKYWVAWCIYDEPQTWWIEPFRSNKNPRYQNMRWVPWWNSSTLWSKTYTSLHTHSWRLRETKDLVRKLPVVIGRLNTVTQKNIIKIQKHTKSKTKEGNIPLSLTPAILKERRIEENNQKNGRFKPKN